MSLGFRSRRPPQWRRPQPDELAPGLALAGPYRFVLRRVGRKSPQKPAERPELVNGRNPGKPEDGHS